MARITYVLTYFNNPDMMKVQLATWHTYPVEIRNAMDFIVVDDCSNPPLYIENANLNLTVLRVTDDITWNLPGARNLGADFCKTPWLLLTDTDMVLTAENAIKLIHLDTSDTNTIWNIKHSDAFLQMKRGFSANMMYLSKRLYWKCCGYNENFSGSYGGQEGHFRSKLFREGGVRNYDHDVTLINFGEDTSPKVISDAVCSTPDMKTEEGMFRAREIAGALYDTSENARYMRHKKWDHNVLRFNWEVAQQFSMPTNYFIPGTYMANKTVVYDSHLVEGDIVYQPHVYDLAFELARQHGCSTVVDIGCGSAKKLAPGMSEFKVIGVDYKDNLEFCKEKYPEAEWIEHDLEETGLDIDIPEDTVIICADVLEHMIDPNPLMIMIQHLLAAGSILILSTPTRKYKSKGPPQKHHIREWALRELINYVSLFVPIKWSGVTKSDDKPDGVWNTSLIVCTNKIAKEDIEVPAEWGKEGKVEAEND